MRGHRPSRPAIAVVGSVNVDLVLHADRLPRAGETVVGATIAESLGGKGADQAIAAARMGARGHAGDTKG